MEYWLEPLPGFCITNTSAVIKAALLPPTLGGVHSTDRFWEA